MAILPSITPLLEMRTIWSICFWVAQALWRPLPIAKASIISMLLYCKGTNRECSNESLNALYFVPQATGVSFLSAVKKATDRKER